MGLESIQFRMAVDSTCFNLENNPCTLNEANYYGRRIIETYAITSGNEHLIQFHNATQIQGYDSRYLINFYTYQLVTNANDEVFQNQRKKTCCVLRAQYRLG